MTIYQKISNAKSTYLRWKVSHDYRLNYVYVKPSKKKEEIQDEILLKMKEENGERFRIISFSPNFFTCGYIYYDKIGDEIFHYFAPSYDIRIPVASVTFNMKPSVVLKEFSHLYN